MRLRFYETNLTSTTLLQLLSFFILDQSPEDVLCLKNGLFTWKDETAQQDIDRLKSLSKEKQSKKKEEQKAEEQAEESEVVPFVLKGIDLTMQKVSYGL